MDPRYKDQSVYICTEIFGVYSDSLAKYIMYGVI